MSLAPLAEGIQISGLHEHEWQPVSGQGQNIAHKAQIVTSSF